MAVVEQTFNLDAVSRALDVLWRDLGAPSLQGAALITAANAQLFLFAPPEGFVSRDGHVLATSEEIELDRKRGQKFIASLVPWIDKVKGEASPEQLQFLRSVGLDGVTENAACGVRAPEQELSEDQEGDEEPDEYEEWITSTTVPEPAVAVPLLEGLLLRYDRRGAEHACIELELRTLRFIVDTKQVSAFLAFLDDIGRPHTPTGAPAASDTPAA